MKRGQNLMVSKLQAVHLYGRVFIRCNILAVTGLHIGSTQTGMEIGGVDSPVIRDPLTNHPYIPGSSLRGKMRSLWEKSTGVDQNWSLNRGRRIKPEERRAKEVIFHLCVALDEYRGCPVCPIYGVPGQMEVSSPTRLVIRDAFMAEDSAQKLGKEVRTDLPFTEVKTEVAIDRVTSAATPRQIERVPAGTLFGGREPSDKVEMVFSIYEPDDLDRFFHILEAMQLLEDDYLGGLGSRGSGKIKFQNLGLSARATRSEIGYGEEIPWEGPTGSVAELLQQRAKLLDWLQEAIPLVPYVAT
jgi:CRISPR-associated protein Csm3